MNILQDTSKLGFLLLMVTACIAFLIGVHSGTVTLDNKDFMILASGAAGFFFGYTPPSKSDDANFVGSRK